MNRSLSLLHHGQCEGMKASVHGVALGTAALCAAYNVAAWVVRRQRHSAVNAALYTAIVVWECTHVRHHVACLPSASDVDERPAA
jgi:hypothetical protein